MVGGGAGVGALLPFRDDVFSPGNSDVELDGTSAAALIDGWG